MERYDGKINLRRQMRVNAFSVHVRLDRETGKAVGRTVAYACFAHRILGLIEMNSEAKDKREFGNGLARAEFRTL